MKPSIRTPLIVAILAAVVAALSACADIERIGQPETPYTMPAGPHNFAADYNSSWTSSVNEQSSMQRYNDDFKRSQKAASSSTK